MSSSRSTAFTDQLEQAQKASMDFIDALKSMDRSQGEDPLGRSPLLHMEMILFVARAEKRRPELAKRLRARKKLVTEIIETTARNSGRTTILDPTWAGALVLALEDGFRLHRLIDPDHAARQLFSRHRRPAADDGNFIGLRRDIRLARRLANRYSWADACECDTGYSTHSARQPMRRFAALGWLRLKHSILILLCLSGAIDAKAQESHFARAADQVPTGPDLLLSELCRSRCLGQGPRLSLRRTQL